MTKHASLLDQIVSYRPKIFCNICHRQIIVISHFLLLVWKERKFLGDLGGEGRYGGQWGVARWAGGPRGAASIEVTSLPHDWKGPSSNPPWGFWPCPTFFTKFNNFDLLPDKTWTPLVAWWVEHSNIWSDGLGFESRGVFHKIPKGEKASLKWHNIWVMYGMEIRH